MTYFTDLFSPETYEAFSRSDRTVSGFRIRQKAWAERIQVGDRFICYMTKMSRWIGVLEIVKEYYENSSPLFYPENDPFVIRFKVRVISWLDLELTIPIHEPSIWDTLSFTKGYDHKVSTWTGKLRTSLNKLTQGDGFFLDKLLTRQVTERIQYPIDNEKYKSFSTQRIRRTDKTVAVTVPRRAYALKSLG